MCKPNLRVVDDCYFRKIKNQICFSMTVLVVFSFAGCCARANESRVPVFMTSAHLLHSCQNRADLDVCIGYIEGVSDEIISVKDLHIPFHTLSGNTTEIFSDAGCVGVGVSSGSVVSAVVNYIKTHPESYDLEASASVYFAIKKEFPCR
jgi:hypothetical protein